MIMPTPMVEKKLSQICWVRAFGISASEFSMISSSHRWPLLNSVSEAFSNSVPSPLSNWVVKLCASKRLNLSVCVSIRNMEHVYRKRNVSRQRNFPGITKYFQSICNIENIRVRNSKRGGDRGSSGPISADRKSCTSMGKIVLWRDCGIRPIHAPGVEGLRHHALPHKPLWISRSMGPRPQAVDGIPNVRLSGASGNPETWRSAITARSLSPGTKHFAAGRGGTGRFHKRHVGANLGDKAVVGVPERVG